MGPRHIRKPEEQEALKREHLWSGANKLQAACPTISRHLAATLVATVPPDGMSAYAARMHCKECGGLLAGARVRLRKTGRRGRVGVSRCKNAVVRTCAACRAVDREAGFVREATAIMDPAVVQEIWRREVQEGGDGGEGKDSIEGKDSREGKGSRERKDREGLLGPRKVIESRKKRKRKKESAKKEDQGRTGETKREGLAASFLFDPL